MAKPPKLRSRWVKWRRRRFGALTSNGLAGDLAWLIAQVEAQRRQGLARTIGWRAAEAAELQVREHGDGLRFALVSGPDASWGEPLL